MPWPARPLSGIAKTGRHSIHIFAILSGDCHFEPPRRSRHAQDSRVRLDWRLRLGLWRHRCKTLDALSTVSALTYSYTGCHKLVLAAGLPSCQHGPRRPGHGHIGEIAAAA